MTVGLAPSSRLGQGVAAGLALLVLALLWLTVAAPVGAWYNERGDRLAERQALLQRMRQVAATLPVEQAAFADPGASANPGVLAGATDAVAAAELQQRLQQIAAASGLGIATVDTVAPAVRGPWHVVSLRIGLKASWPALIDFIRATRDLPEGVFIDDLHIHGDAGPTPSAPPPLQVSMLVYGFRPAGGADK